MKHEARYGKYNYLEGVTVDEPKDEKKDKVRSRKKFIVLAIVAILILAGVFYLVIWLMDADVENLYIGTIGRNNDDTGIKVMALADSSGGASVEGNGRVKIFYNEQKEFDGQMKFKNGEANKEIGFEDFVVGNGDYTVEVSYGNKKDSDVHSINWVTEYICVESILGDPKLNDKGEVVEEELTLPITALNAETTFLFNLPGNIRTNLENNIISQIVIDGFNNYNPSLSDETDAYKLLKMNEKPDKDGEWMILTSLKRYLLKDEGSQFAVHETKGLTEKPKNVEVEYRIIYEENEVHSDIITLNDASITLDAYDYHSTGAGEYRFELEAKNTMIKTGAPLYEGYVSSSLTETLNQEPVATLTGNGFSYDGDGTYASKHYEKTIRLTSSEANDGFEIDFDASYSFNDGSLTHEWDWEYANDLETDMTYVTFDVDDTGAVVSHTFYPDITLLHQTDHLYLGLRVEGDKEIDVTGVDGSKHEELESNIKIIHLEFIYKTFD